MTREVPLQLLGRRTFVQYLGVAGLASLLDVGMAGCSSLFEQDNCPTSPTGRAGYL